MAFEARTFRKIQRFLGLTLPEKLNLLESIWFRLKSALYYRRVFCAFGSGSVLYSPMLLAHPECIRIGSNVTIRKGSRIEAIISDPAHPPELVIGDNVNIEQNVHIVCHSRVIIGDKVSITGHCAIVDVIHPYEDVDDPVRIGARILHGPSFVEIGSRSFLGYNAIVLPNVRIGEYCVIGAHALVTRDVPDYSVVAGSPARVIRHYDCATSQWLSVNPDSADEGGNDK